MIEAEIEKQAEEYVAYIPFSNDGCQIFFKNQIKQVFKDGAKWGEEHATEWHDLRKDQNDLPKAKERRMYRVIYSDPLINEPCLWYLPNWKSWRDSLLPVIAWCELPQFKE